MKNLKNRIQLKIQIPKKINIIEESKNNNDNNNRNSISQITESIYISGYLIGKNLSYLKINNFTHVINCSLGSSMEGPQNELLTSHSYANEGIKFLPIFLRDAPEIDIIYHFFQIIDFIESDKETSNKKILFHCIEGISRAPAMVAGYLMWKNNLPFLNAIHLIKSKRQCADVNLGFNFELQKWENYLFSSPKQIKVFQLSPNIRLLETEEKELDIKENYLIKIQYKLFYFHNIYQDNNDKNVLDNEDIKNNEKFQIFKVSKDRTKEFIKYVIKYDKTLLKNDFSSLIEIR